MQWKHRTKLSWLRARQKHLTASDIYSLVPYTKTGRPKKITENDYLKVWAKKQIQLTEDDCLSFGAAARGHLLEPYAVDSLNAACPGLNLKHVDDELYCSTTSIHPYSLAWSPDAINDAETVMGEIKSYSAERHMGTICTNRMECEERWQIATAMAVTSSVMTGYLILYNPDLYKCQLAWKTYTREDLTDEIVLVRKIEKDFYDWVYEFELKMPRCAPSLWTPHAIENSVLEKQKLNPI